jgi:hypothetical protein
MVYYHKCACVSVCVSLSAVQRGVYAKQTLRGKPQHQGGFALFLALLALFGRVLPGFPRHQVEWHRSFGECSWTLRKSVARELGKIFVLIHAPRLYEMVNKCDANTSVNNGNWNVLVRSLWKRFQGKESKFIHLSPEFLSGGSLQASGSKHALVELYLEQILI